MTFFLFSKRMRCVHWSDGLLPLRLFHGAYRPSGEIRVYGLLHWSDCLPRALLHFPHSFMSLRVRGKTFLQVRNVILFVFLVEFVCNFLDEKELW